MTDNVQEIHRHQLLGVLFGSEVPQALEGQLLRTSDVAMLFQVSERTVSEWAKRGQIPSVRTPGGHRRYPAEGIRALLQSTATRRTTATPSHSGPGVGHGSQPAPAGQRLRRPTARRPIRPAPGTPSGPGRPAPQSPLRHGAAPVGAGPPLTGPTPTYPVRVRPSPSTPPTPGPPRPAPPPATRPAGRGPRPPTGR